MPRLDTMRTDDADSAPARGDFVASVAAGLQVLTAFTPDRPELGVGELARTLDFDKRRTQRLVSTLYELGFLEQDETTRKYRPGIAVLDLGYAALESLGLREVAEPFLRTLLNQFGQSINLSVRSDLDVILVECLRGERYRIGVHVYVGDRIPLHLSSMGKAMLSRLPAQQTATLLERIDFERPTPRSVGSRAELESQLRRARERGFATMDEETSLGVRSVAAPLINRGGRVVAAINVAMSTPLISMAEMEEDVAPAVIAAARQISERLSEQADGQAAAVDD